ncbi:hypothetical protein B0H14DRAFT_2756952, partial [Mycena olivaceomarginata]
MLLVLTILIHRFFFRPQTLRCQTLLPSLLAAIGELCPCPPPSVWSAGVHDDVLRIIHLVPCSKTMVLLCRGSAVCFLSSRPCYSGFPATV